MYTTLEPIIEPIISVCQKVISISGARQINGCKGTDYLQVTSVKIKNDSKQKQVFIQTFHE